jgi:hypothetical protein
MSAMKLALWFDTDGTPIIPPPEEVELVPNPIGLWPPELEHDGVRYKFDQDLTDQQISSQPCYRRAAST